MEGVYGRTHLPELLISMSLAWFWSRALNIEHRKRKLNYDIGSMNKVIQQNTMKM